MPYDTNTKLITCILPKGRAYPLQQALVDKHNIYAGNYHFGRGVGGASRIGDKGIGNQQEREIIEVVVSADKAEELFEFMFLNAEMDEAHGGMMYMTSIPRSTIMTVPEVPSEEV